ncbi:phage baseplate upper protein [Bacillus safensis]|uniref:phage baseplate upper protein n=1 Tax=Bacillus safensis TaxID=561879 RepID=UPI002280E5FB|nr:phage baseplate upper protein [Bacillus safensis]MCY7711319.1 phage baseplate upper protein [Bacillus safensis]MCY7726420.1 phage baseplate upper protein [Bacillus safensis]MED0883246.1 phage baseplate upper protein [Bacillus safensis]MED0918532.1 phage baseplate upper protein [Bacillus safensis]
MLAKDGALSFDVNAQTKRPINAAIQFSTQDINTARLSFKLTKDGVPLPLSAVVGKLVLSMADGSRFIRAVTLVDKPEGLAEYVLAADEIRHYGAVKAELILYYTNGQALSIHKFGFSIEQSLIDQDIVPVAEYYIDDFETLRGQINDLYDDVVATVAEIEAKFEDLDNVETKVGAQEKVDAHAGNTDVHVTPEEKAEWDAKETTAGAQAKVTAHANDAVKHVTNEERSTWNSKETTSGAQQKVDLHANNLDLHVTAEDKTKWNAGQLRKLTADTGSFKLNLAGKDLYTDLLTARTATFYGNSTSANGPSSASLRGFQIAEDNVGEVLAMGNDGSTWRNTFGSGTFRGWRRLLDTKDTAVVWELPTPSNGWKQYVSPDGFSHTLRYSKDAFGIVEILGSITGGALGTNIPAFTLLPDYVPFQSMHFIGVASSVGTTNVPQYHRTYIGTDGKVCIQSCSNTANPNEFITFGFRFRAAKV